MRFQRFLLKFILCITALLLPFSGFTQNANGVEMADALRSNGKIYIVVIVIFTIFITIILFLFSMEKRLKKLEQANQKLN